MASDIVTVRECVGIAFSFAEKFEQSVLLRWDRHAVSLSRWCHCHPLAAASFGGEIMIGQWLRWRLRRVRWQMTRQWLVAAEADDGARLAAGAEIVPIYISSPAAAPGVGDREFGSAPA